MKKSTWKSLDNTRQLKYINDIEENNRQLKELIKYISWTYDIADKIAEDKIDALLKR